MRRLAILVAAIAVAMVALAGTALAENFEGTNGDDIIRGTKYRDVMLARAGDDRILGRAKGDIIVGGAGVDTMVGNGGNDRIEAVDGGRDFVVCGKGDDDVRADSLDSVADDCEDVKIVTEGTTPPSGEDGIDCSDNIDNDGDNLIDYPLDPGCLSAADNTETTGNPPGEGGIDCQDSIDNDGDGKTDFPADPGCTSSTDTNESSDGSDTGDNVTDYVTICHEPTTPSEQTMTVPESALGGHLGHGDTLGPCDE